MSNYPGYFIAFEGLDGSGQTTQAELLEKYLEDEGKKVLLTKEPTQSDSDNNSEVAAQIEAILSGDKEASSKELQGLFIQDREWHLGNVILPALEEGKVVICDRYKYSTIAYGAAKGVNKEDLIKEQEDFPEPDLTVLLKVSFAICEGRIEKRGEKRSIFEEPETLRKIWDVYEELSEEYGMEVVDGEPDIKEVAKIIRSIVTEELQI